MELTIYNYKIKNILLHKILKYNKFYFILFFFFIIMKRNFNVRSFCWLIIILVIHNKYYFKNFYYKYT